MATTVICGDIAGAGAGGRAQATSLMSIVHVSYT